MTSAAGSIRVEIQASDDIMPGVISVPHGCGHDLPGVMLSVSRTLPGASVNDVTGPKVLESVAGDAVVNGVPVRLLPQSN